MNWLWLYIFSAGKYISAFGHSDGPHSLTDPHGITTDNNGNVFVADSENNTIRMYTADGAHIKDLSADEEIKAPKYVCVNEHFLGVSSVQNDGGCSVSLYEFNQK